MKKWFYLGALGLALFEIGNVYFIMPMPGSQRMESLGAAYFLFSFRWLFRIVFVSIMLLGLRDVLNARYKAVAAITLLLVGGVVFLFNFVMTADKMFKEPAHLVFAGATENAVPADRLAIGVENKGEAKAYPIAFIAYHHQVRDTVGGEPLMITYCSVCRSGRVFKPEVNGAAETFRLVGMDRFNAMFEDRTTRSWWRQATGEAVAGKLKGSRLTEVPNYQMTIGQWLALYPNALVMQEDKESVAQYDSLARFEKGLSKSHLTRTDSLSWWDKSWTIGVNVNGAYKAYDWRVLSQQRIINDRVNDVPIAIAMAGDGQSFIAVKRPSAELLALKGDSLVAGMRVYNFAGKSGDGSSLDIIPAYQEFWHSWKTFQPGTETHE